MIALQNIWRETSGGNEESLARMLTDIESSKLISREDPSAIEKTSQLASVFNAFSDDKARNSFLTFSKSIDGLEEIEHLFQFLSIYHHFKSDEGSVKTFLRDFASANAPTKISTSTAVSFTKEVSDFFPIYLQLQAGGHYEKFKIFLHDIRSKKSFFHDESPIELGKTYAAFPEKDRRDSFLVLCQSIRERPNSGMVSMSQLIDIDPLVLSEEEDQLFIRLLDTYNGESNPEAFFQFVTIYPQLIVEKNAEQFLDYYRRIASLMDNTVRVPYDVLINIFASSAEFVGPIRCRQCA